MIIGFYEQAIEDTVPGCMVPCDEQRTKRGTGQKSRDKHIRTVLA
jgi:hypothetical protein